MTTPKPDKTADNKPDPAAKVQTGKPCEECFPGGWPIAAPDGEPAERVSCEHGTFQAPKGSS